MASRRDNEQADMPHILREKLTDEDLKDKVIFSLSQMGGSENGRWLMDIATSEREPIEMRKKALFWASQTGGNLAQLAGLYDRMQNREMKERLIFGSKLDCSKSRNARRWKLHRLHFMRSSDRVQPRREAASAGTNC